MKISNYFTIVVISSYLENGEHMKAVACDTTPPTQGPCHESLTVKTGRACYYGSKNTFASISCSSGYTFTPGSVSCPKQIWIPSSAAECSPKVTTTTTPNTTIIMIKTTTTTVLSTMSSTSKLYPSYSSLFSTVHDSASFHSTSTSATSSTHKVLPSESNFVSTYSTVTSSETPYLTTYKTMSKTKMETSSSYFQTKPSTSSSRQAVISSSIITASPTMVPSDPAASEQAKDSDIISAYIITPVVVCVLALVLGVAFLWWRRRTRKPAASFETRGPGSLIANQIYGANGIDRNCSLINVRQSRVHEYAEIPLDIMNSDGTKGDNYETIDILPEDKAGVKKSYDNLKLSETEFIDTNYSHIGLNNTQNNNHADNTYSHTHLENVTQKPEITVGGDDTYNKLNTTTLTNSRGKHIEDTDTEYNHAQAGGQDPEIEADNYSHLNTNIQTPGMSTTKMSHQQNEDNIKNRNFRQLSAKDLQSNTGYEFAKDFDNSEIKMPKQDDARKNKNSNNYAQDLKSNTGYEFAKDFDYLQNRSEAPEYAKVTKNKPDVSNADNAGKGSETSVGTKHNYFLLEPEQNQAPTTALFNVVEDVSTETDEMPEAETGHEYFTLEKQDMLSIHGGKYVI
ncbi:uncharacterized protein LOC132753400 [Ruditapes philippinarum]|uniref:uncharacterized protein LOC132753400 n=1 Tax=Ruditapes philippinarum TaxID=129788 RepID=UPI00295BA66E|nr:uncharacterized protein LOC132753400 [Ruditapes philippinarum]